MSTEDAINTLLLAIDEKFKTNYCEERDENESAFDKAAFKEVKLAPDSKNMFFIKIHKSHAVGLHCAMVKKKARQHKQGACVSYCVNTETDGVLQLCWNKKCRSRCADPKKPAKFILKGSEDVESSSEDEDVVFSDEDRCLGHKRKRCKK